MSKAKFNPGDEVVFVESQGTIGNYDFSFNAPEAIERMKARYRKQRWKVLKVLPDKLDQEGQPCLQLQRLDTKGHAIETGSQGLFRVALARGPVPRGEG